MFKRRHTRNSIYSTVLVWAFVCFLVSVAPLGRPDALASDEAPLASATDPVTKEDNYIIGAGDVLEVLVWKEPDLSRTVHVRPDGRISLPLIDDIKASGSTTVALKERITSAFADYIDSPAVYVMLQENRSKKIYIIGMVASPGEYLLERPITVLQAIAAAGGFKEWAKKEDIVIFRHGESAQTRVEFNYERVVSGKEVEQNIVLKPDDVIIVP